MRVSAASSKYLSRVSLELEVRSVNSFNRSGVKGVPQMETGIGRNTSDMGARAAKLGTTVGIPESVAGGVMQTSEFVETSEVL